MADHRDDETQAADESLGELIAGAAGDLAGLLSQEVELAKAELKRSVVSAGTGAGMFAGAAFGAVMGILFLSIAAWWGLGTLVGNGWSALIVAVIWLVIAGVAALLGRRALARMGLPQTAETVTELPETFHPRQEG
jgi:hypothetical protein